METVQQNGRFTLFSSKFPSNIYSILFAFRALRAHLLFQLCTSHCTVKYNINKIADAIDHSDLQGELFPRPDFFFFIS